MRRQAIVMHKAITLARGDTPEEQRQEVRTRLVASFTKGNRHGMSTVTTSPSMDYCPIRDRRKLTTAPLRDSSPVVIAL